MARQERVNRLWPKKLSRRQDGNWSMLDNMQKIMVISGIFQIHDSIKFLIFIIEVIMIHHVIAEFWMKIHFWMTWKKFKKKEIIFSNIMEPIYSQKDGLNWSLFLIQVVIAFKLTHTFKTNFKIIPSYISG